MAWVTKSSEENYENNETPREYTKTEKAGNWWHYHKVMVLVIVFAVVCVALILRDSVFRPRADYMVAYVGQANLPDDTVQALTEALQAYCSDLNGDGRVLVQVNQYIADLAQLSDSTTVDPYAQMAGITQISADISSKTGSHIYLLEDPASFEAYTGALRYLDGTVPQDNSEPANLDWTQMVYRWTDCPVLTGLNLGNYEGYTIADDIVGQNQDVLARLYVGFRGNWQEEVSEDYLQNDALWQTLTAGAVSTAGQG